MSIIDTQRIAAVATLGSLGYTFSPTEGWSAAKNAAWTDKRAGCCKGSEAAIDSSALPIPLKPTSPSGGPPIRAGRQGADQRGHQ
jgi:hypothetical protein